MHEYMIAPARPRSELALTLVGAVLIVLAYLAMTIVLLSFTGTQIADGGTAASMLVMLGSFATLTLSVAIVAKLLHKRSFGTLLGPLGLAIPDFLRVLRALLILTAVLMIVPGPNEFEPTLAMEPGRWLALLPFSLLAVLIQTSAEEIAFRGYLQQQLAARFRSPLIWMLCPAAIFAWGHYVPAKTGDTALYIAIWAGFFALFTADITARAGNLGPAVAMHFFNNTAGIVLVAAQGPMSGLALYQLPFGLQDQEAVFAHLPVDFAMMVVSWLAARVAIRR